MSFEEDLEKFKNKTLDKYVKLKRLSAFDLFSAIVLQTPVDKGVLRNNWFATIGDTDSGETTERGAPVGTATLNRIESALKDTNLTEDILLFNNIPYGIPIEFDGTSGKAPEGMVRVNTIRWDTIVANNIKRAGRGS